MGGNQQLPTALRMLLVSGEALKIRVSEMYFWLEARIYTEWHKLLTYLQSKNLQLK
jgi:hypothetical protein